MTDTQQLLARLAQLDCAAICDADKTIRVMDYGIRPISKRPKMVGIAHTVRCRDDFLSVIKGLEESVPGEVLVVDAGGSPTAVVGELFATEARRRGLAGIVVDGACRDTRTLKAMLDFSVYAKHISPMPERRPGFLRLSRRLLAAGSKSLRVKSFSATLTVCLFCRITTFAGSSLRQKKFKAKRKRH